MAKAGAPPRRKLRSGQPSTLSPSPTSALDSDSEGSDDVELNGASEDDEIAATSDSEDEGSVDGEGSDGSDSEESDGADDEDDGLSGADAEIARAVREYLGNESSSEAEDEDYTVDGDGDGKEEEDLSDDEGPPTSDGRDGEESVDEEELKAGDEEKAAGMQADRKQPTEESDSEDEGELASRNTIGDVPLEWYKGEKHVGYDVKGNKITKMEKKDQLETFLARADNSKDWRKLFDEYNDEEVVLTNDEIDMIRRLREGKIPHAEINPYEPYVDWFEYEDKGHPLSSAPEPKRRFIPSKWEAKKVVKLVRAIRKGWISLEKPKEKPKYYLLWGDDLHTTDRTANGLAYIPAPKRKLPGHEESYNPPKEVIPSQEEINGYQLLYEEDRPKYIPKKYDSLCKVPSYPEYIKEQFERCLDLYLCPRTRKKRVNFDRKTLTPELPEPEDLQPFPTTLFLDFRGHTAAVNSIATSPCGEWLASGSRDGSVRLWEVQSGRCRKVWELGGVVRHIAWNPNPQLSILAIAVEKDVLLIDLGVGVEEANATMKTMLTLANNPPGKDDEDTPMTTWERHEESEGLKLGHKHEVQSVAWHCKGDYFVTVNPDGNTRAVLVHQLSKQQTQNPFRKHRGRVVRVLFHPSRPFMFVATKMHVRVYNLVKQNLSKKLMTGLDAISSLAIHSGGDNLLVGSRDSKLCWFDMDLSTKPYKVVRSHNRDVTAVAFHPTYPLFASCSEDATTHVFHGMVYSDLLQNPLIVPVKVLKDDQTAILDCAFHPKQPWLFTAGADAVIKLYCN